MRVFYPISARFTGAAHDEAEEQSRWMWLWSAICVALLVLVLLALSAIEAEATGGRERFSNHLDSHAVHAAAQKIGEESRPVSAMKVDGQMQDYIDAHRCAYHGACLEPFKEGHIGVAPIQARGNFRQHVKSTKREL